MARVYVDKSAFNQLWFAPIRAELIRSDNVIFVYSRYVENRDEIYLDRNMLQYYKLAGEKHRRVDVDPEVCQSHVSSLESNEAWLRRRDCCDDPHLFALAYEARCHYFFSSDTRMARCRDAVRPYVGQRYCNFIVIKNWRLCKSHKSRVLSA